MLLAFLVGCGAGKTEYARLGDGSSTPMEAPLPIQKEETAITVEPNREEETMQNNLILMVNDTVVPVIWEENASVAELREHAGHQALHVEMSMYGGWEQVGSLGHSISRNDVQMTAGTGDIMLYSGNQVVLFYGENTWAYTKLGHIDLPEEEVTDLLSSGAVHLTLAVQ